MIRLLLAVPFLVLSLKATDIADLVPHLDLNSTAHFKSLVSSADDANAKRSDNGKTILMYAVWHGNPSAVEHLLSKGADVNAKDSEGTTALLLAIYKDRTQIALTLINAGADVNATAKDGSTPLIMSKFRQNKVIEDAILNITKETE